MENKIKICGYKLEKYLISKDRDENLYNEFLQLYNELDSESRKEVSYEVTMRLLSAGFENLIDESNKLLESLNTKEETENISK